MKIKQNPKENAAQLNLTKLSNQRPIRGTGDWDQNIEKSITNIEIALTGRLGSATKIQPLHHLKELQFWGKMCKNF